MGMMRLPLRVVGAAVVDGEPRLSAWSHPFQPEAIGSHWDRKVQVDVVALNWQTHDILLGECKWGAGQVDRRVVRELMEKKTPLVLKNLPDEGAGWRVHHALFARRGFTPAAIADMKQTAGLLVDLRMLDEEG